MRQTPHLLFSIFFLERLFILPSSFEASISPILYHPLLSFIILLLLFQPDTGDEEKHSMEGGGSTTYIRCSKSPTLLFYTYTPVYLPS
jgi:hypothetical protein